MRIFVDCTHTAKYTYKNTGIHRVVRELSNELIDITSNNSTIQVVAVMFDGKFMQKVPTINHDNSDYRTKKIEIFLKKIKNKLINLFSLVSYFIHLLSVSSNTTKNSNFEFEGLPILAGDIYIIADANWDLPITYYRFLQNLKNQGVIITIICYDLIPIKFTEFCSKKFAQDFTKFYKKYSKLFDKVLCISQNSAQDYQDARSKGILSNDNLNVIVKSFRLGCDYAKSISVMDKDHQYCDETWRRSLTKRYILVVGSLVPHKNTKTIIEAFDLLMKSPDQDVHLLFAGNKGWDLATDQLIESNRMYGERIHILGSVTDVQLNLLYQNCYCLVQASFYEGFGLPVVEALQSCKPVVASTGGSLPEVGGDFCIYFDPTQPVELYEALKKLLDSDDYYNQLVDRIKKEYKVFSWKECAEEFLTHLLN